MLLVAGGLLFGVGWALAGYCPGTALGALGEGRWSALFVIAGMLVGAALFAEAYPTLKATVLAWKDWGGLGLPKALGVSPWRCIAVLWGVGVVTFSRALARRRLAVEHDAAGNGLACRSIAQNEAIAGQRGTYCSTAHRRESEGA